jgi:competence protein ComFC
MIEFVKVNPEIISGIDVITFVPLDKRSLHQRGFNQSKVLASTISKEFGLMLTDTLDKIRLTKHQNTLTRSQRLVNLKDAFRVRDKIAVKGLNILLIDDVLTTGSTLKECSRALLGGGAKSVRCLTLAKGL